MRILNLLLLLGFLCTQTTAALSAEKPPAKPGLTVVKRAQIGRMYSALPKRVKDNQQLMVVQAGNASNQCLIKFDLSALQKRKIKDAAVFLFHDEHAPATAKKVVIVAHRATSPWQPGKVSWHNRSAAEKWKTHGGDYDAKPLATFEIPAGYGSGWIVLRGAKLTECVQKWFDGESPNHGLLLRPGPGSAGALMRWFAGPAHPRPECRMFMALGTDGPVRAEDFGYISHDNVRKAPLRRRLEYINGAAGRISDVLQKQARDLEKRIANATGDFSALDEQISRFRLDVLKERFGQKQVVAWPISPWADLNKDVIPSVSSENTTHKILQGQFHEMALAVTNNSEKRARYEIKIDTPGGPFRDKLTLRASCWTRFRNEQTGRGVPNYIWVDDVLPRLDKGRFLDLQPGETRRLWITLDSRGLSAGKYPLSIGIHKIDGPRLAGGSVAVEILPVKLRIDPDLHVFNYAYLTRRSTSDCREAAVADLKAHYQNTFVLGSQPTTPKVDAEGNILDASRGRSGLYLDLIPDAKKVLFFWLWDDHGSSATFGRKLKFKSPQWKKALHAWINDFLALVKTKGFDLDRIVMYPADETYDNGILGRSEYQFLGEVASELKEIDPKIRVFMDPVAFRPVDVSEMKKLDPVIDVWSAYMRIFRPGDNPTGWPRPYSEADKQAALEFFQARKADGDSFWSYLIAGKTNHIEVHREFAWRAWRGGATGLGLWSYNDIRGSSWDAMDTRDSDFSMIYELRDAPSGITRDPAEQIIPSRRWQIWRAAIEDYFILQQIALAGPKMREKANAIVNLVLADAKNPAAYEKGRRELFELLVE